MCGDLLSSVSFPWSGTGDLKGDDAAAFGAVGKAEPCLFSEKADQALIDIVDSHSPASVSARGGDRRLSQHGEDVRRNALAVVPDHHLQPPLVLPVPGQFD